MSYNPYFQSNDTPFIGVPGKETTPPYVCFPGQLRCLNEPRVPVLIPTSDNRGFIQEMPANNYQKDLKLHVHTPLNYTENL